MNRADQEAYKRDYAQAKKEGKPFYPYAIYKDHIVAVVVFAGIIGMAIWQRVDGGPAGVLGDVDLRAAAGVVLLLPVPDAQDLQEPERPDAGHHGHVRHSRTS